MRHINFGLYTAQNIGIAFSKFSSIESITVNSINSSYYAVDNRLIKKQSTEALVLGCRNSIIPKSSALTTIGSYAFSNCQGLTELTLPESITKIGSHAFWGCEGLVSINIPKGVVTLNESVFQSCRSLRELLLQKRLRSIGKYAFCGCSSLDEIIIPQGVSTVEQGAFSFCPNLKNVIIDISNVFYRAESNSIIETKENQNVLLRGYGSTIPQGVGVIRSMAFSGSDITSITIPKTVTVIESQAFSVCGSLKSVIFENPEASLTVESYAIRNCIELNNVSFIGKNLNIQINADAFSGCSALPASRRLKLEKIIFSTGDVFVKFFKKLKASFVETMSDTGSLLKKALYQLVPAFMNSLAFRYVYQSILIAAALLILIIGANVPAVIISAIVVALGIIRESIKRDVNSLIHSIIELILFPILLGIGIRALLLPLPYSCIFANIILGIFIVSATVVPIILLYKTLYINRHYLVCYDYDKLPYLIAATALYIPAIILSLIPGD